MESWASGADGSRTLLVDANVDQGRQLIEQLNHAGFRADFAMTCTAARAVLGVDAVLVAPFSVQQLAAKLSDFSRRSRLQAARAEPRT